MYSAIKSPRTRIFIDDALHSKGRPINDNHARRQPQSSTSTSPRSNGYTVNSTRPIPEYSQARMMANAIQRDVANAWQWDMRFTSLFVVAIILMNIGLSFVFDTSHSPAPQRQQMIASDEPLGITEQDLSLEERVLTFRKPEAQRNAASHQSIDLYELNALAPAAGTVDENALLPLPFSE